MHKNLIIKETKHKGYTIYEVTHKASGQTYTFSLQHGPGSSFALNARLDYFDAQGTMEGY